MGEWIARMREVEPARVRAVWAAVAALLAALGVTVSADIDGGVKAGIVVFFAALPLLQGEATRRRVVPVFTVNEAAAAAAGLPTSVPPVDAPVNVAGANGVTTGDPVQDVSQV